MREHSKQDEGDYKFVERKSNAAKSHPRRMWQDLRSAEGSHCNEWKTPNA